MSCSHILGGIILRLGRSLSKLSHRFQCTIEQTAPVLLRGFPFEVGRHHHEGDLEACTESVGSGLLPTAIPCLPRTMEVSTYSTAEIFAWNGAGGGILSHTGRGNAPAPSTILLTRSHFG